MKLKYMDNIVKIEIDNWLKNISDGTAQIIFKILSILQVEHDLQGEINAILVDYKLRKELPSSHFLEFNSIMKKLDYIGVLLYDPKAYLGTDQLVSPETTNIELYIEPFKYLLTKMKERISKSELFYDYDYETKTFQLNLPNGRHASINFRTKRGKKYQSTLFETLLSKWETTHSITEIPENEIIRQISKKLGKHIDKYWLKNTLRHLKETITNNERLSLYIKLEKKKESLVIDFTDPFLKDSSRA